MSDSTIRKRRVAPEVASARSAIGGARRWRGTTRSERQEATRPALAAYADRWLKLAAEQYPDLGPDDLARTAELLKSEHYRQMQLASIRARREGSRSREAGGPDA